MKITYTNEVTDLLISDALVVSKRLTSPYNFGIFSTLLLILEMITQFLKVFETKKRKVYAHVNDFLRMHLAYLNHKYNV